METGLELTLKYAHQCDPAFLEFLMGKSKESEAQMMKRLEKSNEGERKFFRLYKKISDANGIEDLFDIRIAKLYWEANPQIRGFPHLTHNFFLINEYLEKDINKIDKIALYELNECLVHPAKVKEVKDGNIVISQKFISKKEDGLVISSANLEMEIRNALELKTAVDELVSVHHFHPISKITEEEKNNLYQSLMEAIEIYNAK